MDYWFDSIEKCFFLKCYNTYVFLQIVYFPNVFPYFTPFAAWCTVGRKQLKSLLFNNCLCNKMVAKVPLRPLPCCQVWYHIWKPDLLDSLSQSHNVGGRKVLFSRGKHIFLFQEDVKTTKAKCTVQWVNLTSKCLNDEKWWETMRNVQHFGDMEFLMCSLAF